MDIGTTLRDARKHRGLSIEDLSRSTKISPNVLRTIELNTFERLPAQVFTRGFLRAYAREVGLNPQQILNRYTAELVPSEIPEGLQDFATAPIARSAGPVAASPGPTGVTTQSGMTAAVLAAAGIYLLFVAFPRQPAVPAPAAAPQTIAPASVPTSGPTLPAPAPVATAGGALKVEILSRDECWVTATADGVRVVYKTMEAGERRTLTVSDVLALRVGDAAAFSFSVNGVPGRSLGGSGQPVNVRISRDNYRDLLDPAAPR